MNLLLRLPIKRFKIKNKSMSPLLDERDEVITMSYIFSKPKEGDIIVFKHLVPPFIFCKKIIKIVNDKIWVEGIMKENSIDSRNFGFIDKKNIIGKVIVRL